MNTYVLIFLIIASYDHPPATITQEFSSMEACEYAGNTMLETVGVEYSREYICIPK